MVSFLGGMLGSDECWGRLSSHELNLGQGKTELASRFLREFSGIFLATL